MKKGGLSSGGNWSSHAARRRNANACPDRAGARLHPKTRDLSPGWPGRSGYEHAVRPILKRSATLRRYLTEYLNSSVVFWMSVIDCAGPSGPAAKTKPSHICHGTIRVKEGHGL